MMTLVYDGACPFCNNYISKQRLEAVYGPVTLLDARSDDPRLIFYWQQGYPLDDGMLLDHDGLILFGADALSYLARLSDPRSPFALMNRVLKIGFLSRLFYPLFQSLRRVALFLRRRGPLRQPPITDAIKHKAG
jgi:predicted DCC family thiol-disulfide oxidoreductase YuxK